jgi:hypothetical protein
MTGVFAPSSNQSWLTIGTIARSWQFLDCRKHVHLRAGLAHYCIGPVDHRGAERGNPGTIHYQREQHNVYGGDPGLFMVTATASPAPALSESGDFPAV